MYISYNNSLPRRIGHYPKLATVLRVWSFAENYALHYFVDSMSDIISKYQQKPTIERLILCHSTNSGKIKLILCHPSNGVATYYHIQTQMDRLPDNLVTKIVSHGTDTRCCKHKDYRSARKCMVFPSGGFHLDACDRHLHLETPMRFPFFSTIRAPVPSPPWPTVLNLSVLILKFDMQTPPHARCHVPFLLFHLLSHITYLLLCNPMIAISCPFEMDGHVMPQLLTSRVYSSQSLGVLKRFIALRTYGFLSEHNYRHYLLLLQRITELASSFKKVLDCPDISPPNYLFCGIPSHN